MARSLFDTAPLPPPFDMDETLDSAVDVLRVKHEGEARAGMRGMHRTVQDAFARARTDERAANAKTVRERGPMAYRPDE